MTSEHTEAQATLITALRGEIDRMAVRLNGYRTALEEIATCIECHERKACAEGCQMHKSSDRLAVDMMDTARRALNRTETPQDGVCASGRVNTRANG
jgi:hypothetical protein